MNFAIVIPTYNRNDLLKRLLQSIVDAIRPETLVGIWVVENGVKSGSDGVVDAFKDKLNVYYLYEDLAGPSFARNKGIIDSNADFLILFDDDIRIDINTLIAYENAFLKYGEDFFYGGPLHIDYEFKPEDWLLKYLPWSAQGGDLGDVEKLVSEPLFLGANFAISRKLFDKCGKFDSHCPVGQTGLLGEETRLQQRFLESGAKGIYLPNAVVWHYVPSERCSEEWALDRQFRHGLTYAALFKNENTKVRYFFKIPLWFWKEGLKSLYAYIKEILIFSNRKSVFDKKYIFYFNKGCISYFINN